MPDHVSTLAAAVLSGDLARVRSLLHAHPQLINMDRSESDEHRPIHYAVLRRDPAMTRLLMEAGADARKGIFPHRDATSAFVLARDREYRDIIAIIEAEERARREELSCPNATVSPVQDQIARAIAQGDNAAALRLLAADTSLIHACDRQGRTPLHIAAEEGNHEVLNWLLEWRANATKADVNGLTPLDRAALAAYPRNRQGKDFPAIAGRLLDYGAIKTIRAAIALGDRERVNELIAADPRPLSEIDRNGGLLTLAVKHGQFEMVRLLLDLGADVDERTTLPELETATVSWGMPLWYAALAGDFKIAELLLERGADPNANVYASGWPLRNAWDHQDDSVKRLLLARGAKLQPYMVAETHDVNEAQRLLASDPREELVEELLWSAADHGCSAIVALALPRVKWPTADPRWHWVLIQPIRGAGPDDSSNEGSFESLALLLQHGVDPNVARFGQTALHFAAARHGQVGENARARFAAMLLDHGAYLNVRDDLLQSTPLGWACRWGRKELVELLVARGADAEELDAEPWARPQSWAHKMNHSAILGILQSQNGI